MARTPKPMHGARSAVGLASLSVVLGICAFNNAAAQQRHSALPSTQVITPTGSTAAVAAASTAAGRPVSNQDISDAIKQSGLTQADLRAKLQAAGYDPALSDPFFVSGDAAEGNPADQTSQEGTAVFAKALHDIGVMEGQPTASAKATGSPNVVAKPSSGGVSIFGKDVFSRISKAFEPVSSGPVDPSYRVGIGDQLQLVLTGDVEIAYQLDIRRDGTVFIPDVGQVALAGLTLDGARGLLKQRVGTSYSGIETGRTHLDLSLSRVRTNLVYLLGEVEAPGAYEISGLATVFNAIAKANGPSSRGSFRDVELRRGGNTIRHIDLYEYLLDGNSNDDVRAEQGDVIFVPLNKRMVGIVGAVRRPGLFELKDTERFSDLLRFAGGLLPTASTQRVQIDRILPPDKRRPGMDRVIIDVSLSNGPVTALDTLELRDNDVVSVFPIGSLRRNTVTIDGQVFQPGTYEWLPGLRLEDVVGRAEGFLPWALTDRVKVTRTVKASGRSEIFSLDMRDSLARAFPIDEFDNIDVLDARAVYASGSIAVSGAVNHPGTLTFREHLTLSDAIDLANGFREDAIAIEVARRKTGAAYSDTSSLVFKFPIDSSFDHGGAAGKLVLERGDMVTVRGSPGFRSMRSVTVGGLFAYPGQYSIQSDGERIADVIRRAGGPLPTAYAGSFRLTRMGRPVPIDFNRAMQGDPDHDVLLSPGDVIMIDAYTPFVAVSGAVERQVAVPYHHSWGLEDYIRAAGGRLPTAVAHDAIVEYPSGQVDHVRTHLKFFRSIPAIKPGTNISVPSAPPENGGALTQAIGVAVQTTSTVMSLILTYLAIRRL